MTRLDLNLFCEASHTAESGSPELDSFRSTRARGLNVHYPSILAFRLLIVASCPRSSVTDMYRARSRIDPGSPILSGVITTRPTSEFLIILGYMRPILHHP